MHRLFIDTRFTKGYTTTRYHEDTIYY